MELSTNPKHHERTKHIDIRHHVIRQAVEGRLISITKVPSDSEVADILTKPLARAKFEEFRSAMGIGGMGGSLPAPP